MTLALLPHAVGSLVLFGLDGSFAASANGYPLGPQHWWELDNDGAVVRRFDWRLQLGMLESPDGRKVVYGGLDPASGKTGLFVRDMNGPEHFLASSERPAFAWLDADRVLVDPVDEQGIVHAIDTRTGADQIVFAPPPPPTVKPDSDVDYFKLSGDLRWAIFVRASADGARVRQDLFDVARQSYVPSVTLGLKDIWLAPAGDLALWLDGTELRAMHLCDRQVVTIGTVASSSGGVQSIAWSGDHRFASFSFGLTDDLTGPERVVGH